MPVEEIGGDRLEVHQGLCVGRAAKSRLLPATPLVLDSINQKAFVLDRADFE
jgi:hypothetical protein